MLDSARQRAAVLTAGVLIVLSLGLPWTQSSQTFTGGWMVPASCVMGSDGLMTCTGGFISPGYLVGAPALSGASTVARVFLMAALVLLVVAWLRREQRWLLWGGAGILVGALLTGLTAQGGQLAGLAAAALLIHAGVRGPELTRPDADAPATG